MSSASVSKGARWKDWSSHELVTYVAAFILKEWLGYNVELVRLKRLGTTELVSDRFSSGGGFSC